MRRIPVVVAAAALVALGAQPPASAGPAQALCAYDPGRGPVPADFVLDACVQDGDVTVRNSLAVPVAMRAVGDVGAPVRVHTGGGTAAALTRYAGGGDDVVLMPGDVVRWPVGAGAGELAVADADLRVPAAIAGTLAPFLPHREGADVDTVDQQTFGVFIREIAPVVTTRAACVRSRNFLRRAACDVEASAAIAVAVADRLPGRVAAELMAEVLDDDRWREWTDTAVGLPDTGARRLAQSPRPVPPPAAPPPRTSPAPPPPPTSTPAPPSAPTLGGHAVPPGVDLEQWLRALLESEWDEADGHGGNGKGRGKKDDD